MSQLPSLSALEIVADRLVLRKALDDDREGLVELQTDPQVRTYLGGVKPRAEVEGFLDLIGVASVTAAPGSFVIADKATDRLIGTLMLDRRSRDRPGHITDEGEELELSYVLRRTAWGSGLAFEAATATLRAAAAELPDQPVLVVTQAANHRSLKLATKLGFEAIDTFEEFGALQTLGCASLHTFAE